MEGIIFIKFIILMIIQSLFLYFIIYCDIYKKYYIEYYEIGKGIIRKEIKAKSITEIAIRYNNIIYLKEEK